MILSDFLSRLTHDDSNPHDIIPIFFNMHNTLPEGFYKIATNIFSTDMITNKVKHSNITRGPCHKENIRYKFTT